MARRNARIRDYEEPQRRGLLWWLFRAPGKGLLWFNYMFPKRGNVLISARHRGNPFIEVIASLLVYFLVLFTIVFIVGLGGR